jgi:hypothetical protein
VAEQLTIDDFSPWVGGQCQVDSGGERLAMTLVAAQPLEGSIREGGGFRLELLGAADPALEQGIVSVAGPAGAHDIFIVPIGRNAQGTRYEAVFY